MSRASLIEAYISALPLAAVAIISSADGRLQIRTGEAGPGETIGRRYYFKRSHAELVLAAIGQDGWLDEQPAAVVALIEQHATSLGATWQTPEQLQEAAAEAVAGIVARVAAMNQAGGLKQVNREYKKYRQAQVDKAEKAVPYAVFLQKFTAKIVTSVAASGRPIEAI